MNTISERSFRSISIHAGQIPELLAEDGVLDVYVNPDGSLWVSRLGLGFIQEGEFAPSDSFLLLSGIAAPRGVYVSKKASALETIFPHITDHIEGLAIFIVAVQLEPTRESRAHGLATIHGDDGLTGLRKLESLVARGSSVRERTAAPVGLMIFIHGDDRVSVGRKVRKVIVERGFRPCKAGLSTHILFKTKGPVRRN